MSGRHEQEQKIEKQIERMLNNSPTILTEYYYYLAGSGKSYTTIQHYLNYIMAFIKYTYHDDCNEDFYLNVRPVHINRYITSLRTKESNGKMERASDSLRGVHWSGLNSFFQFLVPAYIKVNPVSATQRPKNKDNPNVTYLDKEEIAKLLQYVEDNADRSVKNRDLCILKLGFATGLRVSAIVQIDLDDIDFKNNQIRVTEKGDYDDYILFGDNLKEQLLCWIKDREKYFGNVDSNALFVTNRHQRITRRTIAYIIERYAKEVTDKKVTPHVMRHSCATNLYEQTNDIYLCAKQLRHRQVTTTQRYAELSRKRQKEAVSVLDSLL